MRILIAVDGSESSEKVLQEAVARPWPADVTFGLLTVIDPFFFVRAPLLLDEARATASTSLQSAAEPFRKAGWPVGTDAVLGNPRHAVSDYATHWNADLVVLGSHGLNALTRLLLGSTAQSVLRHAPCSVEIVRPAFEGKARTAGEKMRILVATDGSEFAAAALQSIAGRPWPPGTEVKVISCPDYVTVVGEYPYVSPDQIVQLNKSTKGVAQETVETGAETLRKAGLQVSADVPVARETPARAILDAAKEWNANLIVLGSHGRRGFDRLVIGSVSEAVALHAHCSVEVIRRRSGHTKP
jgi:nucleotide-binding universal stress UspA family protein